MDTLQMIQMFYQKNYICKKHFRFRNQNIFVFKCELVVTWERLEVFLDIMVYKGTNDGTWVVAKSKQGVWQKASKVIMVVNNSKDVKIFVQ